MAEIDVKEQMEELERLYSPPPPMSLIYKVLVFGTIGAFLGVLLVRYIAPEKVPQISYPKYPQMVNFQSI